MSALDIRCELPAWDEASRNVGGLALAALLANSSSIRARDSVACAFAVASGEKQAQMKAQWGRGRGRQAACLGFEILKLSGVLRLSLADLVLEASSSCLRGRLVRARARRSDGLLVLDLLAAHARRELLRLSPHLVFLLVLELRPLLKGLCLQGGAALDGIVRAKADVAG